jgi:hypothetical protein
MKHVQKALATVLATFALAAAAHHGWSGYDTKAVKFNGTIEQSAYENPHGTARVKTAEKTWQVVLAPVSRMEARGLTRDMLKPGTTVAVEGYQHLQDAAELRAERITVADKTIELR